MKRTGDGRESLGKEWLVCWYAGVLVGVTIGMQRDFLPAAQNDHWQEGNRTMTEDMLPLRRPVTGCRKKGRFQISAFLFFWSAPVTGTDPGKGK